MSLVDVAYTSVIWKFTVYLVCLCRSGIHRRCLETIRSQKPLNIPQKSKFESEKFIKWSMETKGYLKYKELIREAGRDEATLVALENQYRSSELEAAKEKDPWALISKPTLKNNPVAPRKRIIAITNKIELIIM